MMFVMYTGNSEEYTLLVPNVVYECSGGHGHNYIIERCDNNSPSLKGIQFYNSNGVVIQPTTRHFVRYIGNKKEASTLEVNRVYECILNVNGRYRITDSEENPATVRGYYFFLYNGVLVSSMYSAMSDMDADERDYMKRLGYK
jgi:hypothetical protein